MAEGVGVITRLIDPEDAIPWAKDAIPIMESVRCRTLIERGLPGSAEIPVRSSSAQMRYTVGDQTRL
jgi:hypothetical protein